MYSLVRVEVNIRPACKKTRQDVITSRQHNNQYQNHNYVEVLKSILKAQYFETKASTTYPGHKKSHRREIQFLMHFGK